jgi:long-chain acyl-CoA synthetase
LQSQEVGKTVIAAPLFHVLALQEQLLTAVFMGRTCILVPSYQPQEIVNLFVRERVNILAMTPTMYWMLLHKTPMRDAHLDSIKVLTYGGAPMPPDLLAELRQTFPGVKCINGYGLTEASVISILNDEFCEVRPTSVGQPALCSEVEIVEPSGKEVGANEVGELAVRGALVSKGYYKLPEETAQVYRDGWFYTGDMAYRDREGFLYLVGRTREMINRGGEKVYPVEVENILHLHPKVLDVAVFGLPDPVLGELVGCAVILRPGVEELSLAEVREFGQKQLGDYKIPQKIFFVKDLPRNPGGKVIKKKLIEQVLNTAGKEDRERR